MNLKTPLRFRVAFESRENYRVIDSDKNLWPAKITGKLREHASSFPAVGDWVTGTPQQGDWILIDGIEERKSELSRQNEGPRSQILATNIDILFIVTSANQDLNLNRLERYLLLASSGNIQPVILINKIELSEDAKSLLDEVSLRFPDTNVHGISALAQLNIECLTDYATEGTTVAFVGSSGVGKSSLTNALLGVQQMHVSEIREEDGRGRHTTTHRELHITENGATVIDTPGIRSVGLTDEVDLSSIFQEVEELFSQCKFTDCAHQTEPGCAVIGALESGSLSEEQWLNYLKLQKEVAFEQRKVNKSLLSQEKKKWAKIHTDVRTRMKLRGRR